MELIKIKLSKSLGSSDPEILDKNACKAKLNVLEGI